MLALYPKSGKKGKLLRCSQSISCNSMKYLTIPYTIIQHHAIWWNYPLSHWSKCKLMNKCGDCSGVKGQGEVLVRRWWLVNRAIGLEAIPPGAGGRGGGNLTGLVEQRGEVGRAEMAWMQVEYKSIRSWGRWGGLFSLFLENFAMRNFEALVDVNPRWLVTHSIRLHFHVSAQKKCSMQAFKSQ